MTITLALLSNINHYVLGYLLSIGIILPVNYTLYNSYTYGLILSAITAIFYNL